MSKSYRKPYGTFCSFKNSARKDKQAANRGVRRKQDSWLRTLQDFDAELVPHRYESCHSEFDRRWAEKYVSVWPPAWYVDLQRK